MALVADLMSRTLHAAPAKTKVVEAATIMARGNVGSTLVVEGGRPVGIFTERDIVRALSQSPEAPGDEIGHWMTANPRTVSSSDSVEEALRRMLEGGFRHLPVVDAEGRLVGMLSMRDLARAGVRGATAKT